MDPYSPSVGLLGAQASSVSSSSTPSRCSTQSAWTLVSGAAIEGRAVRRMATARVVAAPFDKLIRGRDPHGQIGVAEVRRQLRRPSSWSGRPGPEAAASLPSGPR